MTRLRRITAAIVTLGMLTAALPAEAGGYRHGGGPRVEVHIHKHGDDWRGHRPHRAHGHHGPRHERRGQRHHRDRQNDDFDKVAAGVIAGAIIGAAIATIVNGNRQRR